MKINFESEVEPFFQVMVLKAETELKSTQFYQKLKEVLEARNANHKNHKVMIFQPQRISAIKSESFLTVCLKHDQIPTWYTKPINLQHDYSKTIIDSEYDLLIYYRKGDYSFFHTNCNQVFSIIQETIDQLFVDDGVKMGKLTGSQLNLILAQLTIEYRSLGIQNHFGLGGTAPDAKTYFSRDASNSLTPSFDAGYGFSYCLGSRKTKSNETVPFGCSKNKSKIWSTWVKDLKDFRKQSNQIVKWLTSTNRANSKLDVLVQSTEKKVIPNLYPVEFFLDYYIQEKGMVFLGVDSPSLDWNCKYDSNKNVVIFEVLQDDILNTAEVLFHFDDINEKYLFSYAANSIELLITIAETETDVQIQRSHNLITFLNKQYNFTILYNQPFAYRDWECWEDNRLNKVFKHTSEIIKWRGVDITKESSPSRLGKINILDKVDNFFSRQKDVIFCSNDNGANEIADYVVLYESRILLIHAKYASDHLPKLSIGDIQVVASQAVKNTRFFQQGAYTDQILQRLYRNASKKGKLKDFKTFKKKYLSVLQSKDSIKACWVVQPGISIKRLQKDKNNKMHTILNFIDSILKVNNVEFKLVASK